MAVGEHEHAAQVGPEQGARDGLTGSVGIGSGFDGGQRRSQVGMRKADDGYRQAPVGNEGTEDFAGGGTTDEVRLAIGTVEFAENAGIVEEFGSAESQDERAGRVEGRQSVDGPPGGGVGEGFEFYDRPLSRRLG